MAGPSKAPRATPSKSSTTATSSAGRKRASSPSATDPPSKRGTPKKQATLEETMNNGAAESEDDAMEDAEERETQVPSKKRGRSSNASKELTPTKKRGRPSNASRLNFGDDTVFKAPPPGRRGRGRPTNAQKMREAAAAAAAREAKEKADEDESESSTVAEKRGRLSNASKKDSEKVIIDLEDDSENENEPSSATKKRGKPAKTNNGTKEEPETKSETNDNPAAGSNTVEEAIKIIDDIEDDADIAKQLSQTADETGVSQDAPKNAFDEVKADEDEVKKSAEEEQEQKSTEISQNNESVVKDEKREAEIPSSILEKGVIYFFYRGRVGVDSPQGVEDIARSHLVLRPLPLGAKLGDGPLEDTGNARLLALPKKKFPEKQTDRFLMFVEKPNATIKDLREFFASNEYATKTSGTSHSPAATPFAEGVYAITTTGRESHISYQITIPTTVSEIEKSLGIYGKGSYVVSVKNPNAPGPANATLDNPAKYPEHIQSKFRDLRWMPLEPELLDYQNTQFLIIGEAFGDHGKAMEELSKDKEDPVKETPGEELDKLEMEDHHRVENLKSNDPIFTDLGLGSKEYPNMQTTW